MNAQTFLTADYLDIVFLDRNKHYGSYELRKRYSSRMQKALVIVLAACIVSLLSFSDKKKDAIETKPVGIETTLTDIPIDLPAIPKPKPVPIPDPPAPTPSIKLVQPQIAPDVLVMDEMPDVKQLIGHVPSSTTKSGTGIAPVDNELTSETSGGSSVIESSVPAKWVEQMPEFPGDITRFLSSQLKYPPLAKNNNIEGRVIIEFIVNEDGAITNAVVKKGIGSGCDEEALRVVSSMPKWKPGRQNGIPVKVFFTVPIVFRLE